MAASPKQRLHDQTELSLYRGCNLRLQCAKSAPDTVDTEEPGYDTAPIHATPDVARCAHRIALPAKMKRRADGMFASTANEQLEAQTQQELTMTKIALFATAAFIAIATPAAAGWQNGLSMNGLSMNSLTSNSLTSNGLTNNGLTNNSLTSNALSSNAISINAISFNGPSLGGIDGMKVMGIELPR